MELNQTEHQILGHHSNPGPSPSIAQFGGQLKSPGYSEVPKDCGGYMLLWIFNTAECFVYCSLPQICLDTMLFLSSTGSSFALMAWFFQLLDHLMCVHFQIIPIQLNLPQV